MALERQTFTYTILNDLGVDEEITETKVVLPPTKSVFQQWFNCTICSDPIPMDEVTWYKGAPFCDQCVDEEFYEDQRREPVDYGERREGDR
jgi:hypothetical protein